MARRPRIAVSTEGYLGIEQNGRTVWPGAEPGVVQRGASTALPDSVTVESCIAYAFVLNKTFTGREGDDDVFWCVHEYTRHHHAAAFSFLRALTDHVPKDVYGITDVSTFDTTPFTPLTLGTTRGSAPGEFSSRDLLSWLGRPKSAPSYNKAYKQLSDIVATGLVPDRVHDPTFTSIHVPALRVMAKALLINDDKNHAMFVVVEPTLEIAMASFKTALVAGAIAVMNGTVDTSSVVTFTYDGTVLAPVFIRSTISISTIKVADAVVDAVSTRYLEWKARGIDYKLGSGVTVYAADHHAKKETKTMVKGLNWGFTQIDGETFYPAS
jgi:hypothetical protein